MNVAQDRDWWWGFVHAAQKLKVRKWLGISVLAELLLSFEGSLCCSECIHIHSSHVNFVFSG